MILHTPRQTATLKAEALAQLDQQARTWVSLREAAEAIGRHKATVHRWYQDDPVFRAEVNAVNRRNLQAYRVRLDREQAARKAIIDAKWLRQRQAQAAYARSRKRYR